MTVNQQRLDDDELIWLLVLAAIAVSSGALVVARDHVVAWLLDHSVLLPESDSPWISIPGTGGAGLDASRVLLTAAALAAVVIGLVTARRRRQPAAAGGGAQR